MQTSPTSANVKNSIAEGRPLLANNKEFNLD